MTIITEAFERRVSARFEPHLAIKESGWLAAASPAATGEDRLDQAHAASRAAGDWYTPAMPQVLARRS